MPQRLFRFRPANGSGQYRVQLVDCTTGAVVSGMGYTFDVTLSGQPTNALVSGLFDNVPAGLIIPAGSRLKVTDVVYPGAQLLGTCSTLPSTVCAPPSITCSITALTHSLGTTCASGQRPLTYGFAVAAAGSFAVEIYRNSSGALLATETHTVTTPGVQSGTINVPLVGVFPGSSLLMRVVNLADTTCLVSDTANLIVTSDTFTTTGNRYEGPAGVCAAIQVAACAATYRVVAVDCTTGAVLSNQPPEWPVQFLTLSGAQAYLNGLGYTPVQAPTVSCSFGNIRKVALNSFSTYFLPVDTYFTGRPATFTLLTQAGQPVSSSQATLVLSQSTEEDSQGNPVVIRYLQLSIFTATPGTLNWRLVASSSAGSVNIDFSVITIAVLGFQLANALVRRRHQSGLNLIESNNNVTQVMLTPQGSCAGGTTGTLPLVADSALTGGFTRKLTLPVLPRGLYVMTLSNGSVSDTLTVSLPFVGSALLVDNVVTSTTPEPVITHRFRNFEHFEFVPAPVTSAPKIARIDANTCDRITGWIYGGSARIERDGVVVALIDPDIIREQAVIDFLATQGIVTTDYKRGFAYYKPADTGTHSWRVFVGSSNIEATTDSGAPVSVTCGSSQGSNPAPQLAFAIPNWTLTAPGTTTRPLANGQFTDSSGDTAAYSALYFNPALNAYTSLPSWLSINAATGQLGANIDASVANGTYHLKMARTDGDSQSAFGEFDVIVGLVAPLITRVNRSYSGVSALFSVFGLNLNYASGDPYGLQVRWNVGEQDNFTQWQGPHSATASTPATFNINVEQGSQVQFEVRIINASSQAVPGSSLFFYYAIPNGAEADSTIYSAN